MTTTADPSDFIADIAVARLQSLQKRLAGIDDGSLASASIDALGRWAITYSDRLDSARVGDAFAYFIGEVALRTGDPRFVRAHRRVTDRNDAQNPTAHLRRALIALGIDPDESELTALINEWQDAEEELDVAYLRSLIAQTFFLLADQTETEHQRNELLKCCLSSLRLILDGLGEIDDQCAGAKLLVAPPGSDAAMAVASLFLVDQYFAPLSPL
jgi:hypothetical protein